MQLAKRAPPVASTGGVNLSVHWGLFVFLSPALRRHRDKDAQNLTKIHHNPLIAKASR